MSQYLDTMTIQPNHAFNVQMDVPFVCPLLSVLLVFKDTFCLLIGSVTLRVQTDTIRTSLLELADSVLMIASTVTKQEIVCSATLLTLEYLR